jgi:hypothetical protein
VEETTKKSGERGGIDSRGEIPPYFRGKNPPFFRGRITPYFCGQPMSAFSNTK